MAERYTHRVKEFPEREEHLFIVRMWREAGGARSSNWRGSVEHTATKERVFFSSLVALSEFLDTSLAGSASGDGEPPL